MHSGFMALRQHCSYNLRRKRARRISAPEVEADMARIFTIWRETRERYGKGGDLLFGEFTAADCMYAPVVGRIISYQLKVDRTASAYVDAIAALPAYRQWFDAAQVEPWPYASTDALD
jgi:glutathione S-transferase